MAVQELSFESVMKIVTETHVSESRLEEFYAVAQLLKEGGLTDDQQKYLGTMLVLMIERDNWWRSHGAFNDE